MQSVFAHHHFWTALAALGVILSAAYMLTMIQRVFYCDLALNRERLPVDLDAREHLALWPMVALFLIMEFASPLWFRRSIQPQSPWRAIPQRPRLRCRPRAEA